MAFLSSEENEEEEEGEEEEGDGGMKAEGFWHDNQANERLRDRDQK